MVQKALAERPAALRHLPVRLLFEDEGRFGRINDTRRCWMPLPERPVVGQQVVREYVYSFVAVSPWDGQLAALTLPYADAASMGIFLAHTAQEFAGQYCVMFVDGAGWHVAKELPIPPTVRLLTLPPYSPELNPAEHIWEDLRENDFRNDVIETLDGVVDRLGQGIRRLAANPAYVQNLTCFDWIKTIRMTSN
jgi:transposase